MDPRGVLKHHAPFAHGLSCGAALVASLLESGSSRYIATSISTGIGIVGPVRTGLFYWRQTANPDILTVPCGDFLTDRMPS